MMRPIFLSSSSSSSAALLLLLLFSALIHPTHAFVASSASQQSQSAAVSVPGTRTRQHDKSEPQQQQQFQQQHQAVAVNAGCSEWYSPQRVPTALPSKQLKIYSRPSSSSSSLQTPLTSVDDYAAFLNGAGEHELVLIKFHASWCRSCAKLGRKLDQLAHQYHAEQQEEQGGRVHTPSSSSPLLKIGTVEYMAGRDICRALNIEALPTIHLYTRRRDSGIMEKVQDFTCPPSAFDQLQAYCRCYVDQAQQARQQLKVPLVNKIATTTEILPQEEEQSFVEALNRGHALMEASLQDTQKAGKLRSGWKRLFARTGIRLRRVVNGNIEQDAAIALMD